MIKLVKNEFFIYCKETRIESNRSFYGSFCLGPFDTGQSITIANALRRTLLSELKGFAITSAEIEGAFHEYSTLPGVRDSILDILLNLKDIVLKTANYGNKKRGTSYASSFKKTQIGYLKTRGPGIITASELKLPPGIQCVDPDQYIATLSEEGILNIKLMINEGKNYVIQSSYSPNSNSNSNLNPNQKLPSALFLPEAGKKKSSSPSSVGKGKKASSMVVKEKGAREKDLVLTPASVNKADRSQNQKMIASSPSPSLSPSSQRKGKEQMALKNLRLNTDKTGFIAYINYKKKRLWLHKRNLFKIPFLFLSRSEENSFLKTVAPVVAKEKFKEILNFLPSVGPKGKGEEDEPKGKREEEEKQKEIRNPINFKNLHSSSSLLMDKPSVSPKHFSFLRIKKGSLREGVKGFFATTKTTDLPDKLPTKLDVVSSPSSKPKETSDEKKSSFSNSDSAFNLREGGAIAASKAVSLAIDAVFMPVNKVNYIIETNEQSVMSKSSSNKNSNSYNPSDSAFDQFKWVALSPVSSKEPLLGIKELKEKASNAKSKFENNPVLPPTGKGERKDLINCFLPASLPFIMSEKKIYVACPTFPPMVAKQEGQTSTKKELSVHNIRSQQRTESFLKHCLAIQPSFNRNKSRIFPKSASSLIAPLQIPPFPHPKGVSRGAGKGKKIFLKSTSAAQKITQKKTAFLLFPTLNKQNNYAFNEGIVANPELSVKVKKREPKGLRINFSLPQSSKGTRIQTMRLSDDKTNASLKNNIILEIWTNGSIHPRQALYEACKNLLSLFSKLEKATPLAFPN